MFRKKPSVCSVGPDGTSATKPYLSTMVFLALDAEKVSKYEHLRLESEVKSGARATGRENHCHSICQKRTPS